MTLLHLALRHLERLKSRSLRFWSLIFRKRAKLVDILPLNFNGNHIWRESNGTITFYLEWPWRLKSRSLRLWTSISGKWAQLCTCYYQQLTENHIWWVQLQHQIWLWVNLKGHGRINLEGRRSLRCTFICQLVVLDINLDVTWGSLLAGGVFGCPRGFSCINYNLQKLHVMTTTVRCYDSTHVYRQSDGLSRLQIQAGLRTHVVYSQEAAIPDDTDHIPWQHYRCQHIGSHSLSWT